MIRTRALGWALSIVIVAVGCGTDDSTGDESDSGPASPPDGTVYDAADGSFAQEAALTIDSGEVVSAEARADVLENPDATDAASDAYGMDSPPDVAENLDATDSGADERRVAIDSAVDASVDATDCATDALTNAMDSAVEAPVDSMDSAIDAPMDAADSAPADGGGYPLDGATAGVLYALGPGCLECASSMGCLGSANLCENLAGVASEGPAVGESQEELCLDALRCDLSTLCNFQGTYACVCGAVTIDVCESSGPETAGPGNCVGQEQAGLESIDTTVETARQNDGTYPDGVANNLDLCLLGNGCNDCLSLPR